MKTTNAPNWDKFGGQKIFIPFFIYGRDDLEAGPFQGFCRGYGALGIGKRHEETIGIYTAEGVYYNVLIDLRVKCAIPMFFIDDKPFYYPIVACYSMCGGLPAIDPATRKMIETKVQNDEEASQ